MQRVYLGFGAAVVVGAIAAGFAWWYVSAPKIAERQTNKAMMETAPLTSTTATPMEGVSFRDLIPEISLPNTEEGGPQELSLVAFAEKEFEGSNFNVGQVLADNEAYTRYYITYQSGVLTISGIMNVPKGAPPAGGFPLLLLNHGHIDTAVYTNGRGLKREQDYLARQGYVVIHSDYRGHAESDDAPYTDERFRFGYAEDVINAIHAVAAADLSYIDTDRIGMLGHSMGGGVAWRIATTQSGLVDAYVQFAPVSADERDNFNKWIRRRPETAEAIITRYGEPGTNPAFWDAISPQSFFENVTSPIMIHHGTNDDSCPLEWSERTAGTLEAAGKYVTLHVYPGEPHEFINAWPQVMARTTAFFDEHVKNL